MKKIIRAVSGGRDDGGSGVADPSNCRQNICLHPQDIYIVNVVYNLPVSLIAFYSNVIL